MDKKKVQSASSNSIRKARNAAEKHRRDKLNASISDLESIVPFTPYANKRLDKISILRLSAAYLRLHLKYNFLNGSNSRKLEMRETDMMNRMIETLNGFMILLDNDRKIILASHNCFIYLGHQDIDMIGNLLDNYIHPLELEMIQDELQQLKIELNGTSNAKSRSIALRCRMKTRIQPKIEFPNYQFAQLSGYMINVEHELNAFNTNKYLSFKKQRKHPYSRNFNSTNSSFSPTSPFTQDNTSFDSINSADRSYSRNKLNSSNRSFDSPLFHQSPRYLFVGFVQTIHREPFEKLTLYESLQNEYILLFSLSCQIIAADHRISNIIGYMPKEIINNHVNEYIHKGDQLISKIAHQMMLDSVDGTGKIVHRLKTKNGNYSYIESMGKLNFDESRTAQNFVCHSRLLSDAEGEKERNKLVQKYSIQSLNQHQTSDQIPFEYRIDAHLCGSSATCANPTNLSAQNSQSSDNQKSIKFIDKFPALRVKTTTESASQTHNQQTSLSSASIQLISSNYLDSSNQNYIINPSIDTYLEIDQNSVQNSPMNFFIVNHSNELNQPTYNVLQGLPNDLTNCLATDFSSNLDSCLISSELSKLPNSLQQVHNQILVIENENINHKFEQTLGQINDENRSEKLNTQDKQESLNFLDQCPTNGSFNNHSVKCY